MKPTAILAAALLAVALNSSATAQNQSPYSYAEHTPGARLVAEGKLMAHLHHGFWQCMDTLRDKNTLQALWDSGEAPWKLW